MITCWRLQRWIAGAERYRRRAVCYYHGGAVLESADLALRLENRMMDGTGFLGLGLFIRGARAYGLIWYCIIVSSTLVEERGRTWLSFTWFFLIFF